MRDRFTSAKRRLARGKEHVANIKSRAGSFFGAKPYARVVERNAQGFEEHKVKLTKDIPDILTDLTYEALEALRSALDQATYAVAEACNAKTTGLIKRVDLIHFPIADNAADFENVLSGRIKNFPDEIMALFRTFQPYESGNKIIWALNRVRRQGTHRLIVPVGVTIGQMNVRHMVVKAATSVIIPSPVWNSEKNEIVFAVVGPGSNLNYNFQFRFFVAFGPVEGVAGQPVLATLDAMAREVECILLAIEAESRRIGLIV